MGDESVHAIFIQQYVQMWTKTSLNRLVLLQQAWARYYAMHIYLYVKYSPTACNTCLLPLNSLTVREAIHSLLNDKALCIVIFYTRLLALCYKKMCQFLGLSACHLPIQAGDTLFCVFFSFSICFVRIVVYCCISCYGFQYTYRIPFRTQSLKSNLILRCPMLTYIIDTGNIYCLHGT